MSDLDRAAELHRLIGPNATWPELADEYVRQGYCWDEIVNMLGLFDPGV